MLFLSLSVRSDNEMSSVYQENLNHLLTLYKYINK